MLRKRRTLAILLAVIAVLGATAALALTHQPTLGLDLQGGLEVVLEAKAPKGHEITTEDLDRSVEVMRSRVDKLGVAEPEIRRQGTNQIVIELPGVHNSARAAEIVGQTAQLQFYDLEEDLAPKSQDALGEPKAAPKLLSLLTPADDLAGESQEWYLYDKTGKRLAGPETSKDALTQALAGPLPKDARFYAVPADEIVLSCGATATVCPGLSSLPTTTYYYLFQYRPDDPEHPVPEMTGNDLKLQGTRQDFGQNNDPVVTLQFTGQGGEKFHAITRELAHRGQLKTATLGQGQPVFQHFAIVLDREIRSWPQIDFQQYPDGIAGTSAQITGLDSLAEAKDLALVLQTGALPLEFEQVERADISATLGADSLREALIAGIGGILAVAFFLLLFYRFLGLVAVLGLGIYGVLLYGMILLLNVTLTLPGFAGLILTIGVAADANVVIFERIKEEVRGGKSVKAAVAAGYQKGFHTIVDANVVTMITAAVLFTVATGGVKGFALMLLLGTLLSMVTAVAATRALLGLLAGFRWFSRPALMGATAAKMPKWQQVDFVGRRRLWFAVSGAVLAFGLGSLLYQGLNLGIDFEGGSQISFQTAKPLMVDSVRADLAQIGQQSAVIQGRGQAVAGGYTDFQVRTESLSAGEQNEIQQELRTRFQAQSIGVKNVSASFSNQILKGAIIAVIVSLFLIVAYIGIRFQLAFALPVLVALIHDILLTVGVYSLSGREVTAATVAAVLTILGYSIYDTIIIFDRVRENIPLMRRSSFAQIANRSLWETIRRSLATTFITLLPVTALLVFGGDTLKDFAFALLVGIASGAYSTIFIATPLLTIIKEREPEYAKLRGRSEPKEEAPATVQGPPEPSPPTPAVEPTGAKAEQEAQEAEKARQKARQARRARRRAHGRPR